MSTQKAASVPIKSTGCAPSADKTALTEPLPVEQRLPQQHDAGHRDSHGDQIGCFKNTAAVLCGAHGHGQQQADAQQQGHTHAR